MFKFCFLLALLSSEIDGIYGGAFMFTQKPNPFVYFMNGSNAVVEWKYSVDNRMADFQYITWDVEVGGQSTPVMIENATGHLRYTAAYAGRVEKRGQATLVLKDVTFKDSGISLKCFLIHTSRRQNVSSTRLTVTGQASLQSQAQFASFLGSVVFICNATNVPKESFSWLKRHGQTRMMLVDNGQNVTINSAIGSSILTLKNVAEYNKGYYTCDATANVDQSNFVESYLQLPETLKLDGTFSSGRPIFAAVNETQKTLCCPVIGYPPPIVTWEKNGTMLQTGENKCFTIASVKSGHFGNYSCIATDGKTTTDPFVLSLVEKEEPVPDQLTISVIHGTTGTPATLKWEPLTGATYYVVNVDGSDIYGDTVIGARTSLEIHYNTLVMLKGDVDPPKETEICADVIAFSSEAVVIGKAPKCQKLMVKKPVDV